MVMNSSPRTVRSSQKLSRWRMVRRRKTNSPNGCVRTPTNDLEVDQNLCLLRLWQLIRNQSSRRSHPSEALVVIDAHHLTATQPDQRQHGLEGSLRRPDIHHAD